MGNPSAVVSWTVVWFLDPSSLTIIINSAKSFKKLSIDCWKWCLQNQLGDLHLIFFLDVIQPFWHHPDRELLNIKHLMNYKSTVFFLVYLSYHNNFVGRDSYISQNYIINMINNFRLHFWRPAASWVSKLSMPQSWHTNSSQSSLLNPMFAAYTHGFSLEFFFPVGILWQPCHFHGFRWHGLVYVLKQIPK